MNRWILLESILVLKSAQLISIKGAVFQDSQCENFIKIENALKILIISTIFSNLKNSLELNLSNNCVFIMNSMKKFFYDVIFSGIQSANNTIGIISQNDESYEDSYVMKFLIFYRFFSFSFEIVPSSITHWWQKVVYIQARTFIYSMKGTVIL